jgi:UDP-N-acetylmuramyl pentapeptide phosphotransferase/UDP-N-acetylglucosamine-1-phosphate transferase
MDPSDSFRRLRRRAAGQMSYAALFAMFVLWPNLRVAPSVVIVVATALAAVWLVGGLAAWAKIPRADELLLCGSAAPVLIGLTQLAYRLNFLRTHGSLTRPGVETDSTAAFVTMWAAELLLVFIPGAVFVWWNARGLRPLQASRPESASKRT